MSPADLPDDQQRALVAALDLAELGFARRFAWLPSWETAEALRAAGLLEPGPLVRLTPVGAARAADCDRAGLRRRERLAERAAPAHEPELRFTEVRFDAEPLTPAGEAAP